MPNPFSSPYQRSISHGKYNKLRTEDEEADKDTLLHSPSPSGATEEPAITDDQVPLIVENEELR